MSGFVTLYDQDFVYSNGTGVVTKYPVVMLTLNALSVLFLRLVCHMGCTTPVAWSTSSS
jgi:uncharacterized membrane protein YesL